MNNILKQGINSNMLKTIALVAMVIDHIGFYFAEMLPPFIYFSCRFIGRIAMPIFVYLLVQGFFYTKNLKKYIIRVGVFAAITQLVLTILMVINIKYVPNYICATLVYTKGNILWTFVIILCILKLLHEDIIIKKWTYNKNLCLKICVTFIAIIISSIIPLDYGSEALVLGILMYYIEKFKVKLMIEKTRSTLSIKSIVLKSISEEKTKLVYLSMVLFALCSLIIYFNAYWTVIFAIIPIALYNGEKGKLNMKYIYYITFILHHALLYSVAMIITLT